MNTPKERDVCRDVCGEKNFNGTRTFYDKLSSEKEAETRLGKSFFPPSQQKTRRLTEDGKFVNVV